MPLQESSGKVTFLRAHDVGTSWGPPADRIDVEVVTKLDSLPNQAFGFQLRDDAEIAVDRVQADRWVRRTHSAKNSLRDLRPFPFLTFRQMRG